MSVYWVYLSDPSSQIVQPLAQTLVSQPITDTKAVYHAFTNSTIDNRLTLTDTKLAWSYLPGFQPGFQCSRPDTSKHFHIFIGDLCPKLHPQQLYGAFASFGQISECKIIQDPQTLNSRGYGFVTFVKKDDAEKAITSMNGKWIGSRAIRTNWAVRKKSQTEGGSGKSLNYDDVFIQTPASNSTVYCGGVMTGLTEDQMIKAFSEFGNILDIRLFKDKGYAFIRFDSKEAATRAIVEKHLSEVNGHIVKCSWGKKSEDGGRCSPSSSLTHTQLNVSPTLMPTTGYLTQTLAQQPNYANLTFGSSDINNQLRYFLLPESSPKVHEAPILHQQGYSLPIQFPTVVPTLQHPTTTLQQQQPVSYIYSLGL